MIDLLRTSRKAWANVHAGDGAVLLSIDYHGLYVCQMLTPDEAREIGAALQQAADDVGRPPSDTEAT